MLHRRKSDEQRMIPISLSDQLAIIFLVLLDADNLSSTGFSSNVIIEILIDHLGRTTLTVHNLLHRLMHIIPMAI